MYGYDLYIMIYNFGFKVITKLLEFRLPPKPLGVKEEMDKLLECGLLYSVPHSEWVSSIVVVPKKKGKWRICVNFWKLNNIIQKDYFPLFFIDAILDGIAGHECCWFSYGFLSYNQIRIAFAIKAYTTFTSERGTSAYNVMPFGSCNAQPPFKGL